MYRGGILEMVCWSHRSTTLEGLRRDASWPYRAPGHCINKLQTSDLNVRHHLEDLRLDGRTILKIVLKK